MAPRFVEVRRIPLENETISAVIIEGARDAIRFAENCSWGSEVWSSILQQNGWLSEWFGGWFGGWFGEWLKGWFGDLAQLYEMVQIIPKSSKLCFVLCMLCIVMAGCAHACLAYAEWRRLHRIYAK
jgi:hypothetical protein